MHILSRKGLRFGVGAATLFGASLAAITAAQAGAFAVREQSAYFQGMAFAGAAAGDALSSMFWNSAAAAAAPGINSETHISLVVPQSNIEATGGALVSLGFGRDSGDIGDPTAVPASYVNYQLSDRLYFGLATNSQFGFTTKPDNLNFAGTPIATTSEIFSINFNPNLAYKLTPELTVGVGAQIMYASVRLRSSAVDLNGPAAGGAFPGRTDDVDDWAFGATAGVIWQPAPGTSIGVGYRSAIEVTGEGTCTGAGLSNLAAGAPGGCAVPGGVNVSSELTLPDMVTGSIRQRLDDRFTLLGTVEWTNWSRVGEKAEFKNDAGQVVDVFPLGYDDGWFFSAGLEYAWTPDTTLRMGLGYELSPISDDIRNVSLPDNDRVWLSFGASTKLTDNASIDLAYTHLFVKDAPIETVSSGTTLLVAESSGDIDIISASFKYHWGGAEPELEPLK
ncbi:MULTISPECIES: outer membrane protein transport protein [Rhodomicrobium]|uniref:OmpP1/FadL family transporter n=1 Tax=Rhodomicrobium TaxID=1068 RepID=UPI001482532B|nr:MULTISPECIES: outer membrane protein transport protein [Rhodomicrobium]